MRLYLLRHAQAETLEPDDQRPLTRRGVQDVKRLGHLLRKRPVFKPHAIWHSPFERATQTAHLLAEETGFSGPMIVRDDLLPEAPHRPWVKTCNLMKESVLIVGHNPHLAMLAGRLLGGETYPVEVEFKKCGMMCLQRHRPVSPSMPPLWTLRWMLVPHLLR